MVILFDVDGTLVDSSKAILESFRYSFEDNEQIDCSDDDIKSLIGNPLDVMYKELGAQSDKIDNYLKSYSHYYMQHYKEGTHFFKDSEPAIRIASQFSELGIVTTKTSHRTKELLEDSNLMQYFDVVIGREDVKEPKPNKEPIIKAMDCFGVDDSSSVWMIGDTLLDVYSANSANVNIIALSCGYGDTAELKKRCKIVLNSPLEAVKYIKNLKT